MEQLKNRLPQIQVSRNKPVNYSVEVKVDRFSLDINGKVILEDTQLIISKGKKYGLIGENGIGKTTLLYAMARKEIEGMNKDPQILMIE